MPIPPAVLLDLEQDPVRTLVLSSGAEPAAGLVRLGEVVFGVVAFIHSLDDADVLLISCELWIADWPGSCQPVWVCWLQEPTRDMPQQSSCL